MTPRREQTRRTATQAQDEVIAFLENPAAYGMAEPPRRIDTHISVVFLAGDRAYKLKRAVRFPFVDFSTPERRRRFCEAELTVNRRTAPALYERVLPVTREANGTLALGGAGAPVDWLVVMRRFDQDHLFDALAAKGALEPPVLAELAQAVARFHDLAERDTRHGGAEGLRRVIEGSAAELAKYVPSVFDPEAVVTVNREATAAHERVAALLDERREQGFVRHCHGDLHLRNICLLDGHPALFDAIEFNDDLSRIDVLYDLAFLIMDLIHRGLAAEASLVFNAYLGQRGDYAGLGAFPLFLSCRAAIRAHVTAAAAAVQEQGSRSSLIKEARAYLALSRRLLVPAQASLVAVGGLSGTGKSTLAQNLAPIFGPAPGAVVLRSDMIRKRLAGVAPFERLPPDAYTETVTRRVYDTLAADTETVLAAGYSAIADAVFGRSSQREAIESVARRRAAPFAGLWLEAPLPVLELRVTGRTKDASDATPEVVRRQAARPVGPVAWEVFEASAGAGAMRRLAETFLRAHGLIPPVSTVEK